MGSQGNPMRTPTKRPYCKMDGLNVYLAKRFALEFKRATFLAKMVWRYPGMSEDALLIYVWKARHEYRPRKGGYRRPFERATGKKEPQRFYPEYTERAS